MTDTGSGWLARLYRRQLPDHIDNPDSDLYVPNDEVLDVAEEMVAARIAELEAAITQVTAERDEWQTEAEAMADTAKNLDFQIADVLAQHREALAVIAQVRAMHQPTAANTCAKCHHVWPCGTVRILGEES